MQVHVFDHEIGYQFQLPRARPAPTKRKSVAQILRASYRKHVRDAHTRTALRRWLR